MILLCGVPSESPLAMVIKEVESLGVPYVLFNQRHFDRARLDLEIVSGSVEGELAIDGQSHSLAGIRAVYTRLMDDRLLPELTGHPLHSPKRQHCRGLHDLLTSWMEVSSARVLNRAGAMGSNFSKPYQAQLIRNHGFLVPDTLATNRPELVGTFHGHHRRIIYKSISAVRSIVQEWEESDLDRLDQIRWCPTMFQRRLEGTDVRVHVVGDTVFSTAVDTEATDYRYAHRQGSGTGLAEVELEDTTARRCVALAQDLGLEFAGIDLRIDPDGGVYCFEVNPSPAFSYYEEHTGQPIAKAVARYLADG